MERLIIGDAAEFLTPHEATLRGGGTPEPHQKATDRAQAIRMPQARLERAPRIRSMQIGSANGKSTGYDGLRCRVMKCRLKRFGPRLLTEIVF